MDQPLFRWHLITIDGKKFNIICTQWLPQNSLVQISDDLFTKEECEEMDAEVKEIEKHLAENNDKLTPAEVRRTAMIKIRRQK